MSVEDTFYEDLKDFRNTLIDLHSAVADRPDYCCLYNRAEIIRTLNYYLSDLEDVRTSDTKYNIYLVSDFESLATVLEENIAESVYENEYEDDVEAVAKAIGNLIYDSEVLADLLEISDWLEKLKEVHADVVEASVESSIVTHAAAERIEYSLFDDGRLSKGEFDEFKRDLQRPDRIYDQLVEDGELSHEEVGAYRDDLDELLEDMEEYVE